MRQLGDRGIFLQRKARNAPKKFHGMSNAFHQSKPSHEIFSGRFELFVVQKNSSVTQLLTQDLVAHSCATSSPASICIFAGRYYFKVQYVTVRRFPCNLESLFQFPAVYVI
jgi:hypothetical protein